MVIKRLAPGEEVPMETSTPGGKKRSRSNGQDGGSSASKKAKATAKGDKSAKSNKQGSEKKQQQKAPKKESAIAGEAGKKRKDDKVKVKVNFKDAPALEAGAKAFVEYHYEANHKGLSKIELYPSGEPFLDSDFPSQWTFSLDELKTHLSKNKQIKVLIVSASAIRACQLMKPLASLKRPIAKLFAKHMKVEEQVSFLKKRKPTFGIGTPNRVLKLSESKALDDLLEKDALVVFDMQKDVKNFNVLTMPTVRLDAFAFLKDAVLKRPSSSRPKIAFLKP